MSFSAKVIDFTLVVVTCLCNGKGDSGLGKAWVSHPGICLNSSSAAVLGKLPLTRNLSLPDSSS